MNNRFNLTLRFPNCEVLALQICLLTLFAKIKLLQTFPDLQYSRFHQGIRIKLTKAMMLWQLVHNVSKHDYQLPLELTALLHVGLTNVANLTACVLISSI